MGSHDHPKPSR
ncbi:hypothetical protein D018_1285A, partial [Vibrio parahaemolyticus VP2007-007]